MLDGDGATQLATHGKASKLRGILHGPGDDDGEGWGDGKLRVNRGGGALYTATALKYDL